MDYFYWEAFFNSGLRLLWAYDAELYNLVSGLEMNMHIAHSNLLNRS